ncbi:hypothetical protein MSKU15_0416 [Komagataeibacter diospyri]|nr:hypothetical protein MSKU15_0416 [Komagataeibacter diospyri]
MIMVITFHYLIALPILSIIMMIKGVRGLSPMLSCWSRRPILPLACLRGLIIRRPVINARIQAARPDRYFNTLIEERLQPLMKHPIITGECTLTDNYPNALMFDGHEIMIMEKGDHVIACPDEIADVLFDVPESEEKQRYEFWDGGRIGTITACETALSSIRNQRKGREAGITFEMNDPDHTQIFYRTGLGDGAVETCRKWDVLLKKAGTCP